MGSYLFASVVSVGFVAFETASFTLSLFRWMPYAYLSITILV